MEKQNDERNILISCCEYELCAGGGVQQARMTLGLLQQVTLVPKCCQEGHKTG